MAKLIFDIETVGEDFDSLDETTRNSLTQWIKKEAETNRNINKPLKTLKIVWVFRP